jgi:hypothetical protein
MTTEEDTKLQTIMQTILTSQLDNIMDNVTNKIMNKVTTALTENNQKVQEQFDASIRNLQQYPKKSKSKSKSKSSSTYKFSTNTGVKTEPNSVKLPSDSDSSSDSDVIFMDENPTYSNADQLTKHKQDKLKSIQLRYLSKIPHLKWVEEDTDVSNFSSWYIALLKYFQVLSPTLKEFIASYLATIDIDKFMDDDADYEHPDLPVDISMFTRLEAVSAITGSVQTKPDGTDGDFAHLLDPDTSLADVFTPLFAILCVCQPNSKDDRTTALGAAWNMIQGKESITKFSQMVTQASRLVNEQYGYKKLDDSDKVAILKLGIQKGEQHEMYKEALITMAYNNKKMDMQRTVAWLYRNKKKVQIIGAQSASMARTRGGGSGGGRGKSGGRGGKGGKGKRGRGGKGSGSGRARASEDVYIHHDEDGNAVATQEIKEAKSNKPCFVRITQGHCDRQDCPFNHEFKIVDTRKNQQQSSSSSSAGNPPSSSSASSNSAPPPGNYPSAPASAAGSSHSSQSAADHNFTDNYYSDAFAYDVGYKSSSGRRYSYHSSASNCSATNISVSTLFFVNLAKIIFCSFLLYIGPSAPCTALLSAAVINFILSSQSSLTLLCSAASSATNIFRSKYQIILDNGSSFTFSGDIDLFVKSTLVSIDEKVSLSESGFCSKATYFGKINIDGKLIDALFVPSFKQTMISMGQLELQGLKYTKEGQVVNFLTSSGDIYLSFLHKSDNLYYHLPKSNHKSSSASN